MTLFLEGQPGLLLDILVEEPTLAKGLRRADQLPVGRQDLGILEAELGGRVLGGLGGP